MAVQTSNSSPSLSKSKDVRLLATSTTGLIRLKEDASSQSVRLLSVELTEKKWLAIMTIDELFRLIREEVAAAGGK